MPTARTEVTAAILEDNIYIIGGFDESGQVMDIVQVCNTNNNSWIDIVPPPPELLHHTAAVST